MITHGQLDAVILAGGKSERLTGIVPPYHKPFLVVNGKSLLVTAVDEARDAGAEKIVVVATGENAMPVMQLVGHCPEVRVILANGGPGRALLTGLEMCYHQRVLVLMGDNVHGLHDVQRVTEHRYAIGCRRVTHHSESLRFTRLVENEWVEGLEHPTSTLVWCGPLVIQRQRGLDLLPGHEKIGPILGKLAPVFEHVDVSTVDIGVPGVVTDMTRRDLSDDAD